MPIRARMTWLAVAFASAVMAWPAQARAAECTVAPAAIDPEPEEEKKALDQALSLRKEGRDAEAANILRRAYRVRRDAAVLARLALAEAAAADWAQAYEDLTCALSIEQHPWLDTADADGGTRRREFQGFLDNRIIPELGWLELDVSPAGATIRVASVVRATTPLTAPLAVVPGDIEVVVELADHQARVERVRIGKGEHKTLSLRLEMTPTKITVVVDEPGATVFVDGRAVGQTPLQSPLEVGAGGHEIRAEREGFLPSTRVIDAPAAGALTVTMDLIPDKARGTAEQPQARGHKPVWLVVAGVGVLAVAASAVTWGTAEGATSSLATSCAGQTRQECDYDAKRSHIETLDVATTVLLTGGLAVASTGALLWIFDRPKARSGETAQRAPLPRVWLGPSQVGVTYGGRF